MKFSNKLLSINITFTIIAIISLGIIGYFLTITNVINNQKYFAKNYANTLSDNLNQILGEKIKTSISIAQTPNLIAALESDNKKYSRMKKNERVTLYSELNSKWMSIKNPNDPFIKNFTQNKAAKYLKSLQKNIKGEYGEIFITNKYGLIIASTTKLTTCIHSHKYWWKGAYNNGKGKVFLDDRGYDESADAIVLGIVVPILKNNEIIGIIKFNVKVLSSLKNIIEPKNKISESDIKIVRSNGRILLEKNSTPLSTVISENLINNIFSSYKEPVFIKNNSDTLLAIKAVDVSLDNTEVQLGGSPKSIDHKFGNQGEHWLIVIYLSTQKMASVTNTQLIFFLFGSIIIAFAVILISTYFNKKILKPLNLVKKVSEEISLGDFDNRINIKEDNEFFRMADSFNSMLDIIQQKKNEIANILDSLPVSVLYFDEKMSPILVNKHFQNEFQIYNDETEEVNKLMTQLQDDKHESLSSITNKEILLNKNKWFNFSLVAIANEYTGNTNYLVVLVDIHDIKTTSKKYQKLLETATDGIYVINSSDKIIEVSPSFCRMLGYNKEELIGYSIKTFDQNFESSNLSYGEYIDKNDNFYITTFKTKNEKLIKVDISATSFELENTKFIYASARDVTERIKTQNVILQHQRLTAIAEMASGVAHDFNNALQAIMSNIELAQVILDENSPIVKYLNTIETITSDAASRVKSLQRFGGTAEENSEYKITDVNQVVNDVITQTRPMWKNTSEKTGSQITINCDCSEIAMTFGNENELRSVFYNLVKNAIEAMPNGGSINISIKTIKQIIKITIADTGKGMDIKTKERVFDPFFSTKGFEAGRGLGLSGSYSIIDEHKGKIYIEKSEKNIGTTFIIELPKVDSSQAKQEEAVNNNFNDLRVLWIDDEENLAKNGLQLLKEYGIWGLITSSGKDVIKLIEENKINTVITDVGMPGISGWKIAELIREKIGDDVAIILASGWDEQQNTKRLEKLKIKAALIKPFRIVELIKILK